MKLQQSKLGVVAGALLFAGSVVAAEPTVGTGGSPSASAASASAAGSNGAAAASASADPSSSAAVPAASASAAPTTKPHAVHAPAGATPSATAPTPAASVPTAPARERRLFVGGGFGFRTGNGVGIDLSYAVKVAPKLRLAPFVGMGVFLMERSAKVQGTGQASVGKLIAPAGGLEISYGDADRALLNGSYGLVDRQLVRGVLPPPNEDGTQNPAPAGEFKDIYDFTLAAGYQHVESFGLFFRVLAGASIYTRKSSVPDKAPLLPAFNLTVGYAL